VCCGRRFTRGDADDAGLEVVAADLMAEILRDLGVLEAPA
jgi:hypothetical protein